MTALIIGLGTALLAAMIALFLACLIAAPRDMPRTQLLRLYPDLVCLLVGLAKDKRVAWPVRWRLLAALAYNVQPINLIPDFIPVVGLADNLIVCAWAVRGAIRKSGAEVALCHWRGSTASFALVCRLCRLPVAGYLTQLGQPLTHNAGGEQPARSRAGGRSPGHRHAGRLGTGTTADAIAGRGR